MKLEDGELIELDALCNPDETDPTAAVQYGVRNKKGKVEIDGDQHWVKDGGALEKKSDRVVRRSISITYGPWEEV